MKLRILIINLENSTNRATTMSQKIQRFAQKNNINISISDYRKSTITKSDLFSESSKTKKSKLDSIDFHFFKATSKADLSLRENNYNPVTTKLVRGIGLSYAEVACFSSHFRAWKECIEVDSPIVVLEDDIDFNDNFLSALNDILNHNFEYVRLISSYDRGGVIHLGGNFYMRFGNISGTQGYYITPQAAKKFIDGAKSWWHCVDNYMDMFFLHNVFNILYKPFAISDDSQISIYSTIQIDSSPQSHSKAKIKIPLPYKISREIARFYLFSIYRFVYLAFNFYKIRRLKK